MVQITLVTGDKLTVDSDLEQVESQLGGSGSFISLDTPTGPVSVRAEHVVMAQVLGAGGVPELQDFDPPGERGESSRYPEEPRG